MHGAPQVWLWLILPCVFPSSPPLPQFFVLEVYSSDGAPLTSEQLRLQLEKICSASPPGEAQHVGILTTQHRDSWGSVYGNLIKGEARVPLSQCAVYRQGLNYLSVSLKWCFRVGGLFFYQVSQCAFY